MAEDGNWSHGSNLAGGAAAPYAVECQYRAIEMPPEMVEGMRHTPRWEELEAMAPTTPRSWAISRGAARSLPNWSAA